MRSQSPSRFPRRWWSSLRRRSRPRSISLRLEQLEDRITPTGPTLTTLASFNNGNNGAMGPNGVIMDGSGNLYGTTEAGGASNDGTIFELAHGSGTITTLATFNGSNGKFPEDAGLFMDCSGNLYGTTYEGGANNDGTVFEWAKSSGTLLTLGSFNLSTNGAFPQSNVVMDDSGNLYGTTTQGGPFASVGTVFEWVKSTGALTTLLSFDGPNNGAFPGGPLLIDSSGNLYGTAGSGGASDDGTVFEVVQGSATITPLASFNGNNGQFPLYSGVIRDGSGNLYGTTEAGGANGYGTVFELANGSGTITPLASFDKTNGYAPAGGVIMDGNGNLFGTTQFQGSSGFGTVFEVAHNSGSITTLASFNVTNGSQPLDGIIMDGSGNLYGTTESGGAHNDGTVYEVAGVAVVPTDQWTGANFAVDTDWCDGANWSTGAPPLFGQNVLFTNNASVKSFTVTLDEGFANVLGNLTIDSSWGGTIAINSPLTVSGNFSLASGTFGGSGAMTIAGHASQWTGGTIDLGSGGFTNKGTLTADTTGGNRVLTGSGTFTNQGTVNEIGTNALELDNNAALNNAKGAIYNIQGNGSISQSGGGPLTNAGTLEKTKGTGTTTLSTSTLSNTGTVKVTTGTVDISATVNQVSGSTLTAGNWSVYGSSKVSSTLDITSAGSLTTLGTAAHVTLSGLHTTFNNVSGLDTIDKGGSFALLGGRTFTTAGALTNDGAINLGAGSNLTVSGTLTNAGILEKTQGAGSTTVAASTLNNTGTVAVTAGTLNISAPVTQVSGSTLTAGTWSATGSGTVHSTLDITSAGVFTTIGPAARVTLSGLNATFSNLSALSTIDQGGRFSLLGGQSFTTAGALTNNGSLTLGPGSRLTVSGNFTQSSTATLTIQLGGTDSAPTFGQLLSTTGSVSLAGKLSVTSTVVPAVGSAFNILDNEGNAAIGGTFAKLVQGATFTVTKGSTKMTFAISYTGSDDDGSNNVVITRTA